MQFVNGDGRDVSLTRISNAILRKANSVCFINREDGVSVMDAFSKKSAIPTGNIIGYYTDQCPMEWIEDDLSFANFVPQVF